MQHFTCDVCGKVMTPSDSRRYVVKVEVFAAHDPAELTDADLDVDHMEEVSQLLAEAEDAAEPGELAPAFKQFRYDLCPDCHTKFLRDPLNKDAAQKFDFSEN
jgi:hypothetical protein